MAQEKTLRQKIQYIIDNKNLTDYRVAKETGMTISAVQRLRSGESHPDNIRLSTAEKYAKYYDEITSGKE